MDPWDRFFLVKLKLARDTTALALGNLSLADILYDDLMIWRSRLGKGANHTFAQKTLFDASEWPVMARQG